MGTKFMVVVEHNTWKPVDDVRPNWMFVFLQNALVTMQSPVKSCVRQSTTLKALTHSAGILIFQKRLSRASLAVKAASDDACLSCCLTCLDLWACYLVLPAFLEEKNKSRQSTAVDRSCLVCTPVAPGFTSARLSGDTLHPHGYWLRAT